MAAETRKYLIYDVFTERAFAGNPLAVVLDSVGLDTDAMQEIAREFNLSETVFVLPQLENGRTPIRIFATTHEMPFAGHPTVGTAVALTELGGTADNDNADGDAKILVLEEQVGPVRCIVSRPGESSYAEFGLPKLPQPAGFELAPADAAAALGLAPHEIGFENHVVSAWDAGVPYISVPVRDLDVAARARLNPSLWVNLVGSLQGANSPCAYVYCRETYDKANAFHARMFAGHVGLTEDPATGSAVASFAGAINRFDAPSEGPHAYWIEQGVEMGRPSRIKLELDVSDYAIQSARIGGHAVKVAAGVIYR